MKVDVPLFGSELSSSEHNRDDGSMGEIAEDNGNEYVSQGLKSEK